jgi:hypothetical protein
MDLAMYIGEKIHSGIIECRITLVSANAASMSGPPGTTEIQAHACASLVCNDKNCHVAVMLEGTACMVDEIHTKKIQVGENYLPLNEIVNSLTVDSRFNTFATEGKKYKLAMHVQHTKGSFYRTAFCQSDVLLGSQIGKAPLTFGVDMEYLDDTDVLVHMPVKGKALLKNEMDELHAYVKARAFEIHPPLINHDMLLEKLNWAPISLFTGCTNGFDTKRQFMNCMLHITALNGEELHTIQQRCQHEADKFNADPNHKDIGAIRVFACMDGVSKVMSIYTDDVGPLEKCLRPGN